MAILIKINRKTRQPFPITAVHNATRFHKDHVKTNGITVFTDKLADGQTPAKTLSHHAMYHT